MKDWVTIIAALIAFLGVCITVVANSYYNKKRTFIDVVTKERKDFIHELRKLVADFYELAKSQPQQIDKLTKIGYQLKLMMNPAGYKEWDREAVNLINKIIKPNNPNSEQQIKQFVALMQSWLALEWQGMMNEGKSGVLRNWKKNKLRKKYHREYLLYLKTL